MKISFAIIFRACALITAFTALAMFSGCKSADCTNSDTAEYPTQDKWWK